MDYNMVSAEEFGKSLTGLGVNIIVKSPAQTALFLEVVFGLYPNLLSADFALIRYQNDIFQLHSDTSFAAHPSYPLFLKIHRAARTLKFAFTTVIRINPAHRRRPMATWF